MSRIIALTGRAGVGKSTAAAYLAEQHGFTRTRFAGPLKAMLRALYASVGLDEAEIERRIEGDLKEVPDPVLGGKTPRVAMQTLGTEWGRGCIGQELWTDLWWQIVGKRDGRDYVVEDCRFQNEQDMVHFAGGFIVRIVANWVAPLPGGHVSENGELIPDYIIENHLKDDLDNLYGRLDGLLLITE